MNIVSISGKAIVLTLNKYKKEIIFCHITVEYLFLKELTVTLNRT